MIKRLMFYLCLACLCLVLAHPDPVLAAKYPGAVHERALWTTRGMMVADPELGVIDAGKGSIGFFYSEPVDKIGRIRCQRETEWGARYWIDLKTVFFRQKQGVAQKHLITKHNLQLVANSTSIQVSLSPPIGYISVDFPTRPSPIPQVPTGKVEDVFTGSVTFSKVPIRQGFVDDGQIDTVVVFGDVQTTIGRYQVGTKSLDVDPGMPSAYGAGAASCGLEDIDF